MSRRRLVLCALGLAAILAGGVFSLGRPRVTLVNAAVRIDYPWPRAAAAVAAAGGAALVAAALTRRGLRIASGLLAAAIAAFAGDVLAFRLEASEAGLASRGLLGETLLPWRDVSRVQTGPDVVVVWGGANVQVRVDTSSFDPPQRAMLERTVARRVREAKPR